jgi:hypothetical protein
MSNEDKNQNGKRHTKMNLTGKKARKLSNKRDNIEKLQKDSKGNLIEGIFAKLELRRDIRTMTHGTFSW